MATFTLEKGYQKETLKNYLSDLSITQTPENKVITSFKDRTISEASVSDKYQYFDFPRFTYELLDYVENYFQPSKSMLKITGGLQELKLVGERFDLNGETFFKQISILSSSNKTRSLQMNIGLFRLICKNGAFVATDDGLSFKVKHFKTLLPDALDHFINKLPDFNMLVNSQVDILHGLIGKTVNFNGVAEMILDTKEDEEIVNARMGRLKSFSKKLLNSETDSLDVDDLTYDQKNLLKGAGSSIILPEELAVTDIELPADKVFNCYTEVFRNYDSGVIMRESKRILNIINSLS
jgi:hypothetical protein